MRDLPPVHLTNQGGKEIQQMKKSFVFVLCMMMSIVTACVSLDTDDSSSVMSRGVTVPADPPPDECIVWNQETQRWVMGPCPIYPIPSAQLVLTRVSPANGILPYGGAPMKVYAVDAEALGGDMDTNAWAVNIRLSNISGGNVPALDQIRLVDDAGVEYAGNLDSCPEGVTCRVQFDPAQLFNVNDGQTRRFFVSVRIIGLDSGDTLLSGWADQPGVPATDPPVAGEAQLVNGELWIDDVYGGMGLVGSCAIGWSDKRDTGLLFGIVPGPEEGVRKDRRCGGVTLPGPTVRTAQ